MKCIWSDTLHKLVTSADSGHAGLRSGACPVTQEGPAAYCGDAEKGTGFGAGAPAAFHLASTRPVTDGSASSQQCGCGGEVDLDLSALKNIYLDRAERYDLQCRAEAFNIFNHPQFGPPDMALGDGTTGVVSTQLNNPGELQFALKLLF